MRRIASAICWTLLGLLALGAKPAVAELPGDSEPWSGPYLGAFGGVTSTEVRGVSRRWDGSFGANAQAESADDSFHGAGTGLSAGYRHQFTNGVLVGLEGDGVLLRQEGRQDTLVNSGNAWNGMTQSSILREARWISTARLLLGYARGPFMVSITGGFALASLSETRTQYEGVSSPAQTVARFSETDHVTPHGWTLGIGAAWRVTETWSLRLDYLRARFEQVGFRFPDARGGVVSGSGFASVQGRAVENDVTVDMVRLGLTYSFGAGR